MPTRSGNLLKIAEAPCLTAFGVKKVAEEIFCGFSLCKPLLIQASAETFNRLTERLAAMLSTGIFRNKAICLRYGLYALHSPFLSVSQRLQGLA